MTYKFNSEKIKGFTQELIKLKKQTYASLQEQDFKHLKKIIWVNRILALIAFAFIWTGPNPISIICLGLSLSGQWMIVMHHVNHRGYDNVPNAPARYHSKTFAMGWRRFIDWFDWMYPAAWQYEHNIAHHFNTNENQDPDNPSDNSVWLQQKNYPRWVKYLTCIGFGFIWKFFYYAPNIMKSLEQKKAYSRNDTSNNNYLWRTWLVSYIPYFSVNFILLPLLFLPFGWPIFLSVLINRVGAELFTNFQTFMMIVPNHAGQDVYVFKQHFNTKEEFFLAQILGSCNYKTGVAWRDYLCGYLNYQIEHHLFPDLPAAKYVEIQPKIKALCQKYDLPYVQESVFKRFIKMLRIMTGDDTAPCFEPSLNTSEEKHSAPSQAHT